MQNEELRSHREIESLLETRSRWSSLHVVNEAINTGQAVIADIRGRLSCAMGRGIATS